MFNNLFRGHHKYGDRTKGNSISKNTIPEMKNSLDEINLKLETTEKGS